MFRFSSKPCHYLSATASQVCVVQTVSVLVCWEGAGPLILKAERGGCGGGGGGRGEKTHGTEGILS